MIEELPYEVKLKSKVYKLRCLEASKGDSSKGNPMITLKLEITDMPPQTYDGKEYDVNGVQITAWATMTEKARKNFDMTLAAFGFEKSNADFSNIEAESFIGQEATAFVEVKTSNKTDDDGEVVPSQDDPTKPAVIQRRNISIWYPKKAA